MIGRSMPEIVQIAVQSMFIMSSQIYKEQLKNFDVDIVIRPELKQSVYAGFEHAPSFIEAGEAATEKIMPKILKLIQPVVSEPSGKKK